jgi:hypothetical protein
VDLDLDVYGLDKGYRHASMQIWMLKHKPDGEPTDFAKMDAAFMKSVVGLRFTINVNGKRARNETGVLYRKHEFEAKYFDERGTQLLNTNEASKCKAHH